METPDSGSEKSSYLRAITTALRSAKLMALTWFILGVAINLYVIRAAREAALVSFFTESVAPFMADAASTLEESVIAYDPSIASSPEALSRARGAVAASLSKLRSESSDLNKKISSLQSELAKNAKFGRYEALEEKTRDFSFNPGVQSAETIASGLEASVRRMELAGGDVSQLKIELQKALQALETAKRDAINLYAEKAATRQELNTLGTSAEVAGGKELEERIEAVKNELREREGEVEDRQNLLKAIEERLSELSKEPNRRDPLYGLAPKSGDDVKERFFSALGGGELLRGVRISLNALSKAGENFRTHFDRHNKAMIVSEKGGFFQGGVQIHGIFISHWTWRLPILIGLCYLGADFRILSKASRVATHLAKYSTRHMDS